MTDNSSADEQIGRNRYFASTFEYPIVADRPLRRASIAKALLFQGTPARHL